MIRRQFKKVRLSQIVGKEALIINDQNVDSLQTDLCRGEQVIGPSLDSIMVQVEHDNGGEFNCNSVLTKPKPGDCLREAFYFRPMPKLFNINFEVSSLNLQVPRELEESGLIETDISQKVNGDCSEKGRHFTEF